MFPLLQTHSRLLAIGLVVLALGAAYLLVALPLLHTYQKTQENIAQHRAHLVRFERIAATREPLEHEFKSLEQHRKLARYTLDQESTTLAAAALQERVKSIVEQAGGELTSTRILPPVEVGPFYRVTVNVRMNVSIEALQDALYHLESGVPYLLIENVAILSRARRIRRWRNTSRLQELDVRFDLSGLMPLDRA